MSKHDTFMTTFYASKTIFPSLPW